MAVTNDSHRRTAAWLEGICLGFVGLGVLLPVLYASPMFTLYRRAIGEAIGDGSLAGGPTARLAVGITGGSIAGKWLAAWAVARFGVRERRRWALHATVAGLLVWFVVDSVSSLLAGAWANVVMVNFLPLVVVVPLAWRLARTCDRAPAPAEPAMAGPESLVRAVAIVGIGSGLLIAFAMESRIFAPWWDGLAAAHFGGAPPGDAARAVVRFFAGPIGGSTAGQMVLLGYLARHAIGAGERWATRWSLLSLLAWAAVDSAWSVAAGGAFNVWMVNVPFLVLAGAPLVWAHGRVNAARFGEDPDPLPAWSPPPEFEEYRLIKVLGRGAMGTVWLAHDLNLDRAVAIKFITSSDGAATAAGEQRDRFFVEARAVARLHHPNVVTVHRVGAIDGHLYLVSEYVRGTTLDRLPRPVDAAQAFELALGLARGLAAAHRQGVLHRDVKPANAIVTGDREVKLLDFGLAKLFHMDAAPVDAEMAVPPDLPLLATLPRPVLATPPRVLPGPAVTETEAGTVMGTPAYLAPEIWRGEKATAAADVYALGASLFHLVTDRLPHVAGTALALSARVAAEDAPAVRSLRPDCPAPLAEVIDACLTRDPLQRLASGEAVREALELRARAARRPPLPEGNPYRGLAAFDAEHRHLFFGRDLEIADVLERLRAEPWVVVAGRSGAGKSSLVRAGALPRILQDGALSEAGGPGAWRVLTLVPGARPRAALLAAAAVLLGRPEADLARALDEDPGALARELRGDRRTGTVVVIDQLEELVTLSEPDERAAFAEALRHLLVPAPAVRVVATLRSDYVGHLEVLGPVHRELTRALYVLGPMTPEGVRDAVLAPAAAHGVTFEAEADVDELVAAVEENQGSLPLVEFALAKLWELRDPGRKLIGRNALARIGGVAGALSRHADEVLAALPPAAAGEARRILLRLVTSGRTRARRGEEDLVAGEAARPLVRETLEALVRGRLLAAGDGTYEVAHEALIGSWPRLRLWLDEEQGTHQLRERLEVAAADWERLGRRPEALWQGRRLDELTLLAAGSLGGRERAFAEASRRADRRRRWSRRGLLVAVPTALFATILGVQAWNRRQAEARADAAVAAGAALGRQAAAVGGVALAIRSAAFFAFDQEQLALGKELWRKKEERAREQTDLLERAGERVDEALATVSSYPPAVQLAADLQAARFLAADRDHDARARDAAGHRLALYDRSGRHAALLRGDGSLRVSTRPAGAALRLIQVTGGDGDGTLEESPPRELGVSPLTERPLAMGSYILLASAPGRLEVRHAFRIGRGQARAADVYLPAPGDVPAGFAYVPGGPFLYGFAGDPVNSIRSTPLRERTVAPFLMARNEVTFAEWLEYWGALPAGGRAPAALFGLLRDDGGPVLDLRAFGGPVLRPGERMRHDVTRGKPLTADWLRWPVINVSFLEAQAYARWLAATGRVPGARLCTDLEWEKAARGADGRRYPHGDALAPGDASYGDTDGEDRGPTRLPDEVGSHPRSVSIQGVSDLAGNVYEWVTPAVAREGAQGVVRSGSWRTSSGNLRSMVGYSFPTNDRSEEFGARICADLRNRD